MSAGRTALTLALVAAVTPLAAQTRPIRVPAIDVQPPPSAAALLTLAEVGRLGFTVQGAGARSLGMGGAFIGVADDATAASHNPAGLAQLRTFEMSLVAGQQTPEVSYSGMTPNPNSVVPAGTTQDHNAYDGRASRKVEFASFTMPAQVGGRNLVTQISWQSLFDLDLDMAHGAHATFPTGGPTGGALTAQVDEAIRQTGRLSVITGAMGMELTPRILAGVAYNRWSGSWDFRSEARLDTNVPFTTQTLVRVGQRFEGQNWNLGLMWRTEAVRLGLTYRTGFTGSYRMSGDARLRGDTGYGIVSPEAVKLHWPWTLGAGASWRVLPQLLLAVDWSRTPWSHTTFDARDGSSLTGRNLFNPFVLNTNTSVDPVYTKPLGSVPDATAWHAGGEYLFFWGSRIIPVRAGWFREPQPYLDNVTGTTRVLTGFTLGVGVKQGPLAVDLAYKHASDRRSAGVPADQASALAALSQTNVQLGLADLYPFVGEQKVTNDQIKLSVIWQFKGEGLRAFFQKVLIGE